MEEYRSLWESCLEQIRQKVGDAHVFDVWFRDVAFEDYDAETHTLLVQVPSPYVYEYLEQVGAGLLKWALDATFGTGVTLRYCIRREQLPSPAAESVVPQGSGAIPRLHVAGARGRLMKGLQYFLHGSPQWIEGYDDLAAWLEDNKGRGLFLVGAPGLGKTLFCRSILPVFLSEHGIGHVFVSAQEMNDRYDELMKERCVIIDDLGTEPVEAVYGYGRRRRPFYDLCNAAERDGKLLVFNTRLSTDLLGNPLYPDSVRRRYGEAVYSRLYATTKVVILEGPDMRLSLSGPSPA